MTEKKSLRDKQKCGVSRPACAENHARFSNEAIRAIPSSARNVIEGARRNHERKTRKRSPRDSLNEVKVTNDTNAEVERDEFDDEVALQRDKSEALMESFGSDIEGLEDVDDNAFITEASQSNKKGASRRRRYHHESEIFGSTELSTGRAKLELLEEERRLKELLGDSF